MHAEVRIDDTVVLIADRRAPAAAGEPVQEPRWRPRWVTDGADGRNVSRATGFGPERW